MWAIIKAYSSNGEFLSDWMVDFTLQGNLVSFEFAPFNSGAKPVLFDTEAEAIALLDNSYSPEIDTGLLSVVAIANMPGFIAIAHKSLLI